MSKLPAESHLSRTTVEILLLFLVWKACNKELKWTGMQGAYELSEETSGYGFLNQNKIKR